MTRRRYGVGVAHFGSHEGVERRRRQIHEAILVGDPTAEVVSLRGLSTRDAADLEVDRAVLDISVDAHDAWRMVGAMEAKGVFLVVTSSGGTLKDVPPDLALVPIDDGVLPEADQIRFLGGQLQARFAWMAAPSSPTQVFISYSHTDVRFLDRLQKHLAPLEHEHRVEAWSDLRISSGEDWRKQIASKIEHCDVAVLLVSADFLASSFIVTDELPQILAGAARSGRGVKVMSVILKPCRFDRTPSLSQFQAVNDPAEPLISLSEARQEAIYDRVASDIEKAIERR